MKSAFLQYCRVSLHPVSVNVLSMTFSSFLVLGAIYYAFVVSS